MVDGQRPHFMIMDEFGHFEPRYRIGERVTFDDGAADMPGITEGFVVTVPTGPGGYYELHCGVVAGVQQFALVHAGEITGTLPLDLSRTSVETWLASD